MTTGESEGERAAAESGLLSGKVCVVSGVGPGLGRQAARALAAHGADLVLAARRQSTLDDVLAEVEGMGARAIAVPTNITDAEACARLMAAADRGVRWCRRAREQRLPVRRLPEFRGRRPRPLAQDHGRQPVRFAADDAGRASRHARTRRRLGGDGGLHGGAPAPAGAGRLRDLEGSARSPPPGCSPTSWVRPRSASTPWSPAGWPVRRWTSTSR